jgi:hypothetical protein
MAKGIFFQEISDNSADFLHELSDPELVRARSIPQAVNAQLRKEQIRKLETNIETLREKQVEFNRKMEDYVTNLKRLIDSLRSTSRRDESSAATPASEAATNESGPGSGVHVRCLVCENERTFDHLCILFARESDESIHQPTECYVTDSGTMKKGVFFCSTCGGEMLTIQAP